jgi:magnesium transporter
MPKFIKKSSGKVGLPPGHLMHVGDRMMEKSRIRVFDYDETQIQEKEVKSIKECLPFRDTATTTWINIDGLHDMKLIAEVGTMFNIHPLALEDIVNTGHPPKLEEFDDYILIIMKMLQYVDASGEVMGEQFSMIVGRNYIITFQERVGDVFESVRERLRAGRQRIRSSGTDYLAYTLIDAIVDRYFVILEKVGDHIEQLEDELEINTSPAALHKIRDLKREMIYLRKSVWPLREVVGGFEKSEMPLVQKATGRFLRDVYEHTVQVIDTIESFRDMLSGLLEVYLSTISNKMNEVMKVLTIIATIFIPLTFIAGIYGMNFQFMPELAWKWSYPIVWGVMFVVAVFMVAYFRRRKWL